MVMELATVSMSLHFPLATRTQNCGIPRMVAAKNRGVSGGCVKGGVGRRRKEGLRVKRRSLASFTSLSSSSGGRLVVVASIFERFTERAIKVVTFAQREAHALGGGEAGREHLLLGLIAEERRRKGGLLESGITIDRAREEARKMITEGISPYANSTDIPFSGGCKRVFEAAMEHSRSMAHNYIAPEHMAIALFNLLDQNEPAASLLQRLGLNKEDLASVAASRLEGELAKEGRELSSASFELPEKSKLPATASSQVDKKKEKGALADFCIDVTARASEGRIDPIVGRDKEVERVVQILGRRTKNNPILLGDPGVGKTAIAEGLAISIIQGNVPDFLQGKRVMSLDIGLLVSGAKERGELEMRITSLIDEIRKAGNVILLVDEVHMLIGSGLAGKARNGAGLDIANLFKPVLARGQLQCIAATTLDEYRKYIEKDGALARRFLPIPVDEPSEDDAVKIVAGLVEKYEDYHKCRFTSEAVDAAVHLSARYIRDRYLPDKAIDLIDEAGSQAHINACNRKKKQEASILSKSPSEYWREIQDVQKYHETASSRTVERHLPNQLGRSGDGSTLSNLGNDVEVVPLSATSTVSSDFAYDNGPVVVGPDEIAAIASKWSGIPVEQLTAHEQLKLIGLEKQLQTRIIGQKEAVRAVAKALKRARLGLRDPDRPIATMLFCGPTGVGKTELTKALAESYFGSVASMIRLDMSEYMERHTVSKLIGSPPGYVGYGEGGTLTEAVRRQPFAVVLLDEIEKAHPDVFNILLQIFEDGILSDSQGRRVSFKNTLIIMTSNIGSKAIVEGRSSGRHFGFFPKEKDGDKGGDGHEELKAFVYEKLMDYFRPELLTRMDEVVIFRSLQKQEVREILGLMLKETRERLSCKGISLEVSEAVFNRICQEGYDPMYGARPLRRMLTRLVVDVGSEALLADDYREGDTAIVDLDASGNPFVTHRKPDQHENGICSSVMPSTTS